MEPTENDDVLNGGRGGDLIDGLGGDDVISGRGGGDSLYGGAGEDTLMGGDGVDRLYGGEGDDQANYAIGDGRDRVRLGEGMDLVRVTAEAPTNVRLTFTSAEVGNGSDVDGGLLTNQDGGLAVRLQAEADGVPGGALARFDDEGVTFVGGAGVTFDVRDLVSGAARGESFKVVTLGAITGDVLAALDASAAYYINGGGGNDTVTGGMANDFLVGGAADDVLTDASDGADSAIGGGGADLISLGAGDDLIAAFNVLGDGSDTVDTGEGSDVVSVSATIANVVTPTNIRLTFTSAEVGNGSANDSNTMTNQDGGLAVRLQAESDGVPGGPLSRFDDEGVTFVGAAGVTFDVRDLVSGAARGESFKVVTLGTSGADVQFAISPDAAYYFNGGQGNDSITGGSANDFLVGGAGDDVLTDATDGADSAIGGGGADLISLGAGDDLIAAFNVLADGSDTVDTGAGSDVVNVSATIANVVTPTNIRLTFTSAEVGNGSANDSGALLNQDGGLAVRLQAETGGAPGGALSRFDDEGVTFVAGAGVTFDVRDLVSGAARGEAFEVVTLGTNGADELTPGVVARPYYINGGQGNDTIAGAGGNDFLVGGAGDDVLTGSGGSDSFIGGGGADVITGGAAVDTVAAFNVTTDGADSVNLGAGLDIVNVSATAPTNIRLTFTSAEVGNGSANDAGTLANQDGGLAVRLQAETGGTPDGTLSRFDDEGMVFVAGAGVAFDVRDLVSGAARGEAFEVVSLGTAGDDVLTAVAAARPYYFNAGGGNDTVVGGDAQDFLVGNVGDDELSGGTGADTFLGGAGADTLVGGIGEDRLDGGAGRDLLRGGRGVDTFVFALAADSTVAEAGRDEITKFESGEDRIDLSALLGLVSFDQIDLVVGQRSTVIRIDLDGDTEFDDFGLSVRGDAPTMDDFVI